MNCAVSYAFGILMGTENDIVAKWENVEDNALSWGKFSCVDEESQDKIKDKWK